MRRLLERRWLRMLIATGKSYSDDNCGQMAAAIAFFALLSIFPLLLLLVSQIPTLLARFSVNFDLQEALINLLATRVSPQAANWIGESLNSIEEGKGTASIIGVLTLLWSASGVFGQIDLSINRIWHMPDEPQPVGVRALLLGQVRGRFLPFLLVVLVAFLMLLSSVVTTGIALLQQFFPALPFSELLTGSVGLLVSVAISVVALALLYRFVPRARVRWSDVWLGALVGALVNEMAKSLVAYFITSGTGGAYQTVAGPLALMIWVFFTMQILLAGCELTRQYALHYGSRAQQGAVLVQPTELRSQPARTPPRS